MQLILMRTHTIRVDCHRSSNEAIFSHQPTVYIDETDRPTAVNGGLGSGSAPSMSCRRREGADGEALPIFPHQREEAMVEKRMEFVMVTKQIVRATSAGRMQADTGERRWSRVGCRILALALAFLMLGPFWQFWGSWGNQRGEERSFSAAHVAARGLACWPQRR